MDNDFEDEIARTPRRLFKPGDVVRLKSGGPPMTVEIVDDASVATSWFISTDGHWHPEPQTSRFIPEALELVPAAKSPPETAIPRRRR